MFNRQCSKCGDIKLDCLERMDAKEGIPHEGCEGQYVRVWLPNSSHSVISDEIDVTVPEAVAKNPDGSPRRFRSREELKRVTTANGWTNLVEHRPSKDSDKSKTTTRWY